MAQPDDNYVMNTDLKNKVERNDPEENYYSLKEAMDAMDRGEGHIHEIIEVDND